MNKQMYLTKYTTRQNVLVVSADTCNLKSQFGKLLVWHPPILYQYLHVP